jgi:hypothetical protein
MSPIALALTLRRMSCATQIISLPEQLVLKVDTTLTDSAANEEAHAGAAELFGADV